MNSFRPFITIVLAFLMLFNSGCALAPQAEQLPIAPGQVEALQPGAAQLGIQAAQSGKQLTEIWTKGSMQLLVWQQGSGIGFLCAGCSGKSAEEVAREVGANITTPATFSSIAAWLKTQGWSVVRGTINGLTTLGAFMQSERGFLLIPVTPEMLEQVKQKPQG